MIQTPAPRSPWPDNLGGLNAHPADSVTNGGGMTGHMYAVNGCERGISHNWEILHV